MPLCLVLLEFEQLVRVIHIGKCKVFHITETQTTIQAEDKRKGAEIQKEKRRCEIAEPQGILRKIGDAETWQYIRGTGKDEADVAKQKKQIAPLFQVERSDNENKKYYTNDKRTELT